MQMASEEHVVAEFKLGQRVQSVKPGKVSQVGTVKYVGAVDGHEGEWIGVDWDSGQGRHNGTVNGRQYFDTAEEQSGSLMRPQHLDSGVTLLEAINRRYDASGSVNEEEEEEMYVLSVRQKRMAVELVGKAQVEARQKQLQHLFVASLAYAGVRSSGPPGQIRAQVPNMKELDLSGNLLPDWLAVGNLCAELPSMEVLNLSYSRLGIRSEISLQEPFNIKTLVLNYCHITWKQVEQVKGYLSNVEELHLCGNKIQTIEDTKGQDASSPLGIFVEGFESLRFLDLEDNCIESWSEIMKLSHLTSLEHLNLTSNKIQEIVYPYSRVSLALENVKQKEAEDKESCHREHFQSLCCLLLAKNRIADWASIDALNNFPSIQELRLTDNPLTNTATGGALRFMLIARIQKLRSLNGSQINARERGEAEIRYLRNIVTSATGGSLEDLEELHPRLKELRRIYDVSMELGRLGGAKASQKMSATLLAISIQCVSSSAGEKLPITKKLPASTTVGKLKLICEVLFKLKAAKQCLYLKDQDPLPVLLDVDSTTLGDLGLGAGAVILVDDAPDR